MLRTLIVACAAVASEATCDPDGADTLTRAIDAAIMELLGQKGWFHDLRASSGYPNAMSVQSCTPDAEKWRYPEEAAATGVLARVLKSGKLRVAGVQWKNPPAADYTTDPLNPTGFWPKYMDAIVAKMVAHYGKPIALERVYYANSVLVVDAVANSVDVDMSEPYYYIAGFHANNPRIESMAFSCVTAGLGSKFFTRLGSGITSVDTLYDALVAGPNRAVGFIGQGNYDAVSAMLPEISPTMTTDGTDMVANVLSGALVAGYVSEGEPANASLFEIFDTGIIAPRVSLFRKDHCLPPADADGPGNEIIATIVVAAVALVLALLLSVVVARERVGKPIFMPLLNELTVDPAKQASPQL